MPKPQGVMRSPSFGQALQKNARKYKSFSTEKRERESFIRKPFNLDDSADDELQNAIPLSTNNDKAEKQRIILERMHISDDKRPENNTLSPMGSKDLRENRKFSRTNNEFSEAQQVQHFDFCMKLSSENKINAQNAFSLHLIDYFSDAIAKRGSHGQENNFFQMASLSLQASMHIYSCRIDALYSDTLKMMSTLSFKKTQNKTDNVCENNADDESPTKNQKVKAAKQSRKGQKKRFHNPLDDKSLNGQIETVEEPHEKFYLIRAIFDGLRGGSMLYELSVENDQQNVPLSTASFHLKEKQPYFHSVNGASHFFNVGTLGSLVDKDLPVVPALDVFSFAKTKWPLSAELSNHSPCLANEPDIAELVELFDTKCLVLFPLDVRDSEKRTEEIKKEFEQLSSNEQYKSPCFAEDFSPSSVTTPYAYSPPLQPFSPRKSFSFKTVMKSFQNSMMEPPPTPCGDVTFRNIIQPLFKNKVDPIIEAVMTGRKLKTKKISSPVTQKRKQAKKICNLVIPFEGKLTIKKKASCVRSTLKWDEHDKILPEIAINKNEFFYQLLLFRIEASSLFRKFYTDIFFDANGNAEDRNLSYLDSVEGVYDEPYGANENDANCSFSEYNNDITNLSLHESDLVPKPEMVKPVPVFYSKTCNNINQKRLKSTLFSIISDYYANKETGEKDLYDKEKKLTFSLLFNNVQNSLPQVLKNKLTVSICFVSLLHLANEKSLSITNVNGNAHLNELHIERDLENPEC